MSDFFDKVVKIPMGLFLFICFAVVMSWFMLHSIGSDSGAKKARAETVIEGQEYVKTIIQVLVDNGIIIPVSEDEPEEEVSE